jgi:U3 small nucleolar RNA-associated protein 11
MSMKHILKTRTYKERSQPAARAGLGLLEKHKDYVLRAKDYHKKEDALRTLREKAAFKNPDEYYKGMVKSQVRDGVHRKKAEAGPTNDQMAVFKKEDASYLNYKRAIEGKKIERLRANLHNIDAPLQNTHTLFADDADDARAKADGLKARGRTAAEVARGPKHAPGARPAAAAAGGGGTSAASTAEGGAGSGAGWAPSGKAAKKALLRAERAADKSAKKQGRARKRACVRRPLLTSRLGAWTKRALSGAHSPSLGDRAGRYSELEQRLERHEQMGSALSRIATERALQGKGKRKKLRSKQDGPRAYKWRQQRKG